MKKRVALHPDEVIIYNLLQEYLDLPAQSSVRGGLNSFSRKMSKRRESHKSERPKCLCAALLC